MPMTSAARRASLESSIVQHPRAPERYDAGLRDSARWMPVTSWPASWARAAATAESTPPDMAATTLTGGSPPASWDAGAPGTLDGRADRLDERVDVGLGRRATEGEPQRVASTLVVESHREQDVRRLGHAGGAGRPGGALDATRVEQHQQRVALAVGEAEMGVARQPLCGIAVQVGIGYDVDHPGHEGVAQGRHPLGVLGLDLDRVLDGGGEPGDGRHVERAAADVALLTA